MGNFKFFRKVIYIAGLIFLFVLVSFFTSIFSKRKNRTKNLVVNCSYFCRRGLNVLGIRIKIKKNFSYDNNKTYLIVSNHLSYLDVLIIASIFPASFITSVEISKDIFLGSLAKLGGSVFIERRNKARLIKDLESVSRVLSKGFNVVLFPEGTSTNGETVLPFKKTLFRSAIYRGIEILPLYIHYISINETTVNRGNRDLIFWYGSMKFFPHFIKLLKLRKIDAELYILQSITTIGMKSDVVSKLAHKSIYETHQRFFLG